jgi:hypothetical protein
VDQDVLLQHEVRPWSGERSLPLWLPLPRYGGFMTRDVSASLAAGLTIRDLAETARDTLAWYRSAGEPELACGLSPAAERDLLRAVAA